MELSYGPTSTKLRAHSTRSCPSREAGRSATRPPEPSQRSQQEQSGGGLLETGAGPCRGSAERVQHRSPEAMHGQIGNLLTSCRAL